MLVVLFIIISFAASMTISVSACPEELLFFLVALFGFGFFFSFINMVYVIIIIANYFFHLNYQTMHCSKQTHIKGFCTSMTFGFKTLSYHHVNTYPGPIFSIKRKAGIFCDKWKVQP